MVWDYYILMISCCLGVVFCLISWFLGSGGLGFDGVTSGLALWWGLLRRFDVSMVFDWYGCLWITC